MSSEYLKGIAAGGAFDVAEAIRALAKWLVALDEVLPSGKGDARGVRPVGEGSRGKKK